MLLSPDLHEDFINEKCISITLVPTSQSPGILGSKLVTPQTNGLVANRNVSLSQQVFDISMTHVKPMIEPHSILNDFRGESVAFVWAC